MKSIESQVKEKPTKELPLTALSLVFTVALTFATLELPRILAVIFFEAGLIDDINVIMDPEATKAIMEIVRPIGYACLLITLILIVLGLYTKNSKFSSLGALFVFLPTFGYFAGTMFFLAGLGILRVAWLPFWETGIVDLGDIVYLPYMVLTYLIALLGIDLAAPIMRVPGPGLITIDLRWLLAFLINGVGLFIFFLGTMAWVSGKYMRQETVTFWIYKYSRHPQYLGYIIWSYGVMLQSSLAPLSWGGENLGVSLPWVFSSIIVICIALKEEIDMIQRDKEAYISYRTSAPFMFSIPPSLCSIIKAPFKAVFKKNQPENSKELLGTFILYSLIVVMLSSIFLILKWVPGQMIGIWPYNVWPFNSLIVR